MDRMVGFDLNFAESILEDLARFHGTVIAFKLNKPDIFETRIRPLCTIFNFKEEENTTVIFKTLRQLIKTYPEYGHLAEKATRFSETKTPATCREPFGTIIHFDLWVNNILNKIEKDGRIKNVFVDFQVYGYRSPAADVFFFLWTSVKYSVLKQNLDHLLIHYHRKLLDTLKHFSVDTSEFEYKNFEEELRLEAEFEFGHALLFKFFLMFVKEIEIDDYKLEIDELSPELREDIHYMVTECAKRRWL